MTPQQWQIVRELFEAALLVEPDRQAAWLAEQCGSDEQLQDAVRRLLGGHQEATRFLDRVQESLATLPVSSDLAGRRVGSYLLQDVIGKGGMGVVYRASRADEAFEKTVAIKLMGPRYAVPEIERAFFQERQILATLEHPHIARLLDGGTTPEGLLYLVMELVDGEPIDAWCQHHTLSLDSRLALFEDVCSAVHYAHRNLIVHRDLKPKNILVAQDGQVKLLDFGIAKVLSHSVPGETLTGALTPQYASPEQLLGKPITTASDIYSLGAVLYELLTDGAHPYAVTGQLDKIIDAICLRDPPSPSASAPPQYASVLRGELDNIVMKAMAKDPDRRYSSVEQLREDLRRYRTGLPVLAQGDSLSYRFRKFVRRRRAIVAAAALVAISLASGVASTLYEAGMARRQRNLAEKRYNDVRSLATTVLFDIHDSIKNLAGSNSARKLTIDKGLEYLEALAPDSEGDVELQAELAAGYERAGSLLGNLFDSNTQGGKAAAPALEKALRLRKQVVGQRPGDPGAYAALALSILYYGNSLAATGNIDGAIARYREGLAVAVPPSLANETVWLRARTQILSRLCNIYPAIGDAPAAIPFCRESIALTEKLAAANPRDTEMKHLWAMDEAQWGNALRLSGGAAEAVTHFRLALDRIGELIRQNPNDANLRHSAATTKVYLANSLHSLGDPSTLDAFADAVHSLEESLAGNLDDTRRVMVLAYAMEKYSELLRTAGRPAEAERSLERGLALYRQMAVKPAAGALELNNYASALAKCPFPGLKNPALALELAQRANELTKGRVPTILDTLAWAYYQNGRIEEACRTDRTALSMLPAQQGPSTGMRKDIEESLAQFESAPRVR